MLLAVEDLTGVSHCWPIFQAKIDLMAFDFFSQQALEKVLSHREY